MTSNEDFLFAQEAVALGFVTDAQVSEALELQRRMSEELRLDERLSVILVKRGYLADDQVRRVYAKTQPEGGGPGQIHGYRLLEVVGRGAMGTVYRAMHLGLNREVAVKILRPDLAGDRTQVERLKAEAAMLASLDHPNIVRALDAGESNGFPYVVMEYVEGESLRDRLRDRGPMPEDEALRVARDLADALERARRMGVVHRDVKPGNVLLTRNGTPKLMDLGLAKGPIDLGLTQHGATVGTPQYIAPEQALDPRKADTRSDIYSLGATLYAMLTGVPPFDGRTLAEILTKVLYEVPPPVRSRRPEVSAETGYLVERMMLRDPTLRYRTPAQVVVEIDRLRQGQSILPEGFSGNWEAWLLRRRVRKTTLLAGAGVLAGLLVAVGGKVVLDARRTSRARDEVARRITALVPSRVPMESSADLDARAAVLEGLAADAARTDASGRGLVEQELRAVRDEQLRVRRLRALLDDVVVPAVRDEDFASAEQQLRRAVEGFPSSPPAVARRHAELRLQELLRASDEALADAARGRAYPSSFSGLDEVVDAATRWAARVASRYSKTPARDGELLRAQGAQRAAERIVAAVAGGVADLGDARLRASVDALEWAPLLAAVARGRRAAEEVLREQGDALTGTERRYVSPSLLARLVAEPFEQRRAAVDALVEDAWVTASGLAFAQAEHGDPTGAIARLDAFAEAALRDASYPDVAQRARQLRDDLSDRTRAAREAAEAASATLTRDVVAALRAGDLDRVDALVTGARARDDLFAPVARDVEDLARAAPAMRRLQADALEALLARVGPAKERWVPSIQLRGDAQPEKNVELLAVSREERTFDYQTHRGGGTQARTRRRLADIVEEDLFRLAGSDPTSAQGAWLLGVLGIAAGPVEDEDFYAAIPALETVVRRFRDAAAEDAPLARWAGETLARRVAEADRNEREAREHLETGRRAMAEGHYPEANYHFRALLDPTVEPTLRLPSTKTAREARDYLEKQVQRLRQEFNVGFLETLWPGARVTRRDTAPPDVLDVSALFDFEGQAPLKASFESGWARVVPAPIDPRAVTPDRKVGRALRLLPGATGEAVGDRPLVLASPFAAGAARSVTFRYWADAPLLLAIDLDGVQVAVLSDPPTDHELPRDAPLLPDEAALPRWDTVGRGRGVRFRVGSELGDPTRWGFDDAHQGRHFVPPTVSTERVRSQLGARYFAFAARERPYLVRFTWEPDNGARLEVDGALVLADRSAALLAPKPSGKIRILSWTACTIDDLEVSGRVDPAWIERRRAESAAPAAPPPPRGASAPR